MQKMNKLGLSQVVQTSLLILLSISALFVIWGYVKDLTTGLGNTLSPAVDCITQQSKIESACIDKDGKVQVKLNVIEELNIAEFRLNEEFFYCGGNLCASCSISDSAKTIYLEPEIQPLSQENLIASLNGCAPESILLNPCTS